MFAQARQRTLEYISQLKQSGMDTAIIADKSFLTYLAGISNPNGSSC